MNARVPLLATKAVFKEFQPGCEVNYNPATDLADNILTGHESVRATGSLVTETQDDGTRDETTDR